MTPIVVLQSSKNPSLRVIALMKGCRPRSSPSFLGDVGGPLDRKTNYFYRRKIDQGLQRCFSEAQERIKTSKRDPLKPVFPVFLTGFPMKMLVFRCSFRPFSPAARSNAIGRPCASPWSVGTWPRRRRWGFGVSSAPQNPLHDSKTTSFCGVTQRASFFGGG